MAFAIFFIREDVTPIAAEYTRSDLSPQDAAFAQSCWRAGLDQWNTAPLAPQAVRDLLQDQNVLAIVVDGKHQGQNITLAQFCDFMLRQSVNPNAEYLRSLAEHLLYPGSSFAQEPYP